MARMTITYIITDFDLWWPYTDQGKTPWRVRKEKKRVSMREKPKLMWIEIGAQSTASDMNERNEKKRCTIGRKRWY